MGVYGCFDINVLCPVLLKLNAQQPQLTRQKAELISDRLLLQLLQFSRSLASHVCVSPTESTADLFEQVGIIIKPQQSFRKAHVFFFSTLRLYRLAAGPLAPWFYPPLRSRTVPDDEQQHLLKG